MSWYVIPEGNTYDDCRDAFSWDGIPDDYNIASDCIRKHDDAKSRVALYQAYPDGTRETYTFHEIDVLSNRLANALEGLGIERGSRVAIIDSQRHTTLIAHMACWKLGAISVPLSPLFGTQSLRYRLEHSGAAVAIAAEGVCDKLTQILPDCPALQSVVRIDADGSTQTFGGLISDSSRHFDPVATDVDTPAIVLYTSGSTGKPKGVLHTHGIWIGHCTAFYTYFECDVFDSVYWTPADWAWIGALGSLVFPAWHYGEPVVGYCGEKFDAATAFEVMAEFGVTDAFISPTAVRMLISADISPRDYEMDLETVVSGSEPLTPEIVSWVDETFADVTINEGYGQTETSVLATYCLDWYDFHPGSMGKPVVGFDVEVIDSETGDVRPPGRTGEIAVHRAARVGLFEEYWNSPELTAERRIGEWHLTGDLGVKDEEGYLWFKGRVDDVIITSGYRVAPGDVERVLLEHPAVDEVGVVGVPDEIRGKVIKAVVQLERSSEPSESLREELQSFAREQLATYAYPRVVEFVSSLPRTDTGKLDRKALETE